MVELVVATATIPTFAIVEGASADIDVKIPNGLQGVHPTHAKIVVDALTG